MSNWQIDTARTKQVRYSYWSKAEGNGAGQKDEQYPETMTDLPQLYSLDGKPSGPNCGGLYPSAKGCREYFSADVETAIHIGMNGGTPFDTIPAAISAARELRFVFLIHSLIGIIG